MQSLSLKITSLFFAICSVIMLSAQEYNYPLNPYSNYFLLSNDSLNHGAFQGLPESWLNLGPIKGMEPKNHYSTASKKLFDDHLINIESEDFTAHIDLLLHFELGFEQKNQNEFSDTTRFSRNLRGFIIRGNIGEKVSFESSFRELQSSVPYYLYQFSEAREVMPGTGRFKPYNSTGRDHNIAEGYISYSPSHWVNLQFGTHKNFIGSGYRSLLLSDNTYTYPQLKASFKFWDGKLTYHMMHAWLQTQERLPLGDTPESLFIRKNGSFKYLEYKPSNAVSIGLFESVIWNRFNPEVGNKPINALAFSPLIGSSSIGLDGQSEYEGVARLGLDLNIRPIKGLIAYGQYLIDSKAEGESFQLGVRTIDLALQGLSLRAEYNTVGAFAYSADIPRNNYGHFRQELAHPMGAGFDEVNTSLLYFRNRWFADLRYVHAQMNANYISEENEIINTGGNIFSSASSLDLTSTTAQYTLDQVDIRIGRMFNPKSNFNAYLGWLFRERKGLSENQSQSMVTFGIEMSLYNRYEDF